MPGYATVNAFFQLGPVEQVVLSLNVSNLFDTRALTDVYSASIPASGVLVAQSLLGRTISTGVRFYF
ncbi:TonB-dependent receptor [Sphingobium sufflavum]|uniref:TonB-dependent receptor n=1 Tax=Sphingobium sufflavum TaxID=1129547 RepID=UPI001F35B14C|nr:TonB-dependent receptor [Sphingobium sufflavum]MCE7795377.1 TonB-dependent receptor [Sphingobium sufflavum]